MDLDQIVIDKPTPTGQDRLQENADTDRDGDIGKPSRQHIRVCLIGHLLSFRTVLSAHQCGQSATGM